MPSVLLSGAGQCAMEVSELFWYKWLPTVGSYADNRVGAEPKSKVGKQNHDLMLNVLRAEWYRGNNTLNRQYFGLFRYKQHFSHYMQLQQL